MGECPPLPSPDLSKQLNRSTSDTPRSGSHLNIVPYYGALLTFDIFTEAPRPRPKRLRTDSLLSVSIKLILIELGYEVQGVQYNIPIWQVGTEGGNPTPPPSPPPPPSYKLSRRRAQVVNPS